MSSPAEAFITYFEKCKDRKILIFAEYLDEQFSNKWPVEYNMKYKSTLDLQIKSIRNVILKNLQLNPYFRIIAVESVDLNLFENLYVLIKSVLSNNYDENCLPELLLYLVSIVKVWNCIYSNVNIIYIWVNAISTKMYLSLSKVFQETSTRFTLTSK